MKFRLLGLAGLAMFISSTASASDDIVWRHKNGRVHYWPMKQGRRTGGVDIHTPVGKKWRLVGVGDLNGDGWDDIVWRHKNGQVHYWPMRDGRRLGGIDIHTRVGKDWRIVGIGNVDGRFHDDIVWRHKNGQVHYWPIRNGRRLGGINIHTRVGKDWKVVGVGQIDGRYHEDIVWRHKNGQLHYWPIRSGRRLGGINIHTRVGRKWTAVGVGNVDGKDHDDIVWRHKSGQVHYWPIRSGRRMGGINIHTPVGGKWRLRAVGNVGTGKIPNKVHRFGVSRYRTSSLTTADADRILRDASTILQRKDGSDDVATQVEMRRVGNVGVFGAGNGVISSNSGFRQVLRQRGSIHVVNAINWCGDPGTGIIGCAPIGGGDFVVVRFTPSMEGTLWAHEFGHNQGLRHRNGRNNIMNPFITPTAHRVNAAERGRFLQNISSPQGGLGAGFAASSGGNTDVETFVRRHYFDGVPYAEAAKFSSKDLPRLKAVLNNRRDKQYWANAAGVIGAIGGDDAADTLIKFVERNNKAELDGSAFRAGLSAVVGLGYSANKGTERAFGYLRSAALKLRTAKAGQGRRLDSGKVGRAAVLGLSLAGNNKAEGVLKELRGAKIKGTESLMDDAMKTLGRVKKGGLIKLRKR